MPIYPNHHEPAESTSYKVITAKSASELERAVNRLLAEGGWQVTGGVSVVPITMHAHQAVVAESVWAQALVKWLSDVGGGKPVV